MQGAFYFVEVADKTTWRELQGFGIGFLLQAVLVWTDSLPEGQAHVLGFPLPLLVQSSGRECTVGAAVNLQWMQGLGQRGESPNARLLGWLHVTRQWRGWRKLLLEAGAEMFLGWVTGVMIKVAVYEERRDRLHSGVRYIYMMKRVGWVRRDWMKLPFFFFKKKGPVWKVNELLHY